MSYIVQVPSTYLTLRFVQLGLTFVTLAVDIASIVLLSQYEVVNYGPTAWGIWTVIFTFVCVAWSIRVVKAHNGVPNHVFRIILDCLLILKWFVLWVYLAESAANVATEGASIGLIIALAAEAVIAAIQWVVCIVVLVIFINARRRSKNNQQAMLPTQINVTPGKMDQSVPLLAQNASTAYPGAGAYPQGNYQQPQHSYDQATPLQPYQHQTGYAPQQTAYPSQTTAYPPQTTGYAPQQTAYPPQTTGYAPQATGYHQPGLPLYSSPTSPYPVPTRDLGSPVQTGQQPQYQQVPQPIQPVPQSVELSSTPANAEKFA